MLFLIVRVKILIGKVCKLTLIWVIWSLRILRFYSQCCEKTLVSIIIDFSCRTLDLQCHFKVLKFGPWAWIWCFLSPWKGVGICHAKNKNRSGGMVRVFWLWCFLCHSVPTFVVHEVIVSTVILLMYTNVMQCSRLQHHRNIFLRQMYASWCKVAWTIVSFLTVCRLHESKQHSNILTWENWTVW